jgi:hypothetical protein
MIAVAVHRTKPPKSSPTFEKLNLDRLKQCEETPESARRNIETSKRLAEESRELLENIHKQRQKAG